MSALSANDLGDLPEWDLGALYAGIDDPKFAADFAQVEKSAKEFAQTWQGKLASLDGAAFGAAIRAYEAIEEILGRIYRMLRWSMSHAWMIPVWPAFRPMPGRAQAK